MSIPTDTIATFRTEWAARFVDTITVKRTTDRGTFNATTLAYDGGTDGTPYSGPGLARPLASKETAQYGEQLVTATGIVIFLPYDAGVFDVEDEATIDVSYGDTELEGKTVTVVAVTYDSYRTRQRLVCRLDQGAGYVD
jgi:hypothetical protein